MFCGTNQFIFSLCIKDKPVRLLLQLLHKNHPNKGVLVPGSFKMLTMLLQYPRFKSKFYFFTCPSPSLSICFLSLLYPI